MKQNQTYDMRGMGHLLHMYSQAGGDTESKVEFENNNIEKYKKKSN